MGNWKVVSAAGSVGGSGSSGDPPRLVTADTTIVATDTAVYVDATTAGATPGTVTLTLPDVTTLQPKLTLSKVDSSTNTVTIVCSGSDTIQGQATQVLSLTRPSITIGAP